MLRKAILGIGALAVGFVLGTVFGFGNGVEYQKDKRAKEAEPGFPNQSTEGDDGGGMVHIDLENQLD